MIFALLLLISAAPAMAGAITTATCDGITVTGTTSAACNNHLGDSGTAGITFGPSSVTLAADVSSNAPFPPFDNGGGAVTATASYSQAYTLFVQSGPAGLLFRPCLTVYSGHASGGGWATMTGNGLNASAFPGVAGLSDPCLFAPSPGGIAAGALNQPIQIPVGVAVSFSLNLFTSASCSAGGGCQFSHFTDSRVSLSSLEFYDSNLNLLNNVSYQFVPAASPNTSTVPEPSTWMAALILSLSVFALARIRGRESVL